MVTITRLLECFEGVSMRKFLAPLAGAAVIVLAPSAALAKAPTELHFGSEPWHLALSLGNLKPSEGAESGPERKVYTYEDGRGTLLSVIVEHVHEPATLASCKDVFSQRKANDVDGVMPVNEVESQRGEAATQEYDLQLNFEGKSIMQHNSFSCRVRGDYYIDVHASKVLYQLADHDALMRLIDAVAIVD